MMKAPSSNPGVARTRARKGAWARLIVVSVALACASAFSLEARGAFANPGAEGEPAFGISGYFKEAPRLDETCTLLIRLWGEDTYPLPVITTARIGVPEGIEVVSGDTVHVTTIVKRSQAKGERTFQLGIRPARHGSFVIRGTLGIDAGGERGYDETDFVVRIHLTPDSVSYSRASRPTRFESTRMGRRYRFAGRYLVPIDTTEALLQEEIDKKAQATLEVPAYCQGCPEPLPAAVPFVVMIGSDGRIRESRFLDLEERGTIDPAAVSAAYEALSRWGFAPASAKGRAVADYLVVRVPVRNGPP